MDSGAQRRKCAWALVAGLLVAALPVAGLLVATPAAATPAAVTAAATDPDETHRFAPVCAPARPGYASCMSVVDLDAVHPLATSSAVPSGFGPAELQAAYNLPSATAGSGHTVAIVDAYDLPTAQNDLNVYRAKYGLPVCGPGCFTKVDQTGGTALPPAQDGWAQEIALDLDMVSAACPNCKILLVEAASAYLTDLGTAVNTAVRMGAVAVSNSYGGPESLDDASLDNSYFNHPGVAITASSGDTGYGTSYPAGSQYVTAVGGTSLYRGGPTRGFSESAWSGAGSGCSSYHPKPGWQHDTGCATRTISDVSAVADPYTGLAVYGTKPSTGQAGWSVVGGTSASAPLVAGIYALASAIPAGSTPATFPYANPSGLNDVTTGSNGSCGTYVCNSGVGYDGPTGLGTPNGISAFSASTNQPPTTTTTTPPTTTTSPPTTTAPVDPTPSGGYVAVDSTRVADTRTLTGAISGGGYTGGPLAASSSYTLNFATARMKTGQAAYVFNVTAIGPRGLGNLQIAPGSTSPLAPSTSLINYQPGKDVANLVIVPNLPGSGFDTVRLYSAGAGVDVAIDLVGYYPAVASGVAAAITAVTPSRIADTRTAGGAVAAGQTRAFQVGGIGGIPKSGAKAVALNVTAINPSGLGNLRVFADGAALPLTSNINYIPGQDKSAFVIVNLPANGKIDVYSAGTPADVTLDAYASYDQTASSVVTQNPARAFDSRPGGTLAAGTSTDVQVAGVAGVPANAVAVLISVTGIHTSGSTGGGFLRVYSAGGAVPNASTLNYVSSTSDVANFAVVGLGPSGKITVNTQGSPADVTVDVLGYEPGTTSR